MNSAIIFAILEGIKAAITAAPLAIEVVEKAKALISSLFTAKVITAEQQNALHLEVDAYAAMVAAGIVPLAWQVEPDPQE
jgi:hypothetical protein